MGKKYIIELEDKPFCKGGDFLYRVKGFNSLVFDMNGIQKLILYTEPDLDAIRNETWEAARKIGSNSMCSLEEMGFDFGQCVVNDYNPSWFVVKNYSASECIEKIRQYEENKKKHTWICSEVNEPSVDTTLICSECGYTMKMRIGDTPALNFCPKCGDCKKPKEEES